MKLKLHSLRTQTKKLLLLLSAIPLCQISSISLAADEKKTDEIYFQNLIWSGDLRYRVAKIEESIDQERNYQQLRARLGLKASIKNDLNLIFRMATGTSAISTNQTLGDSSNPGMPRRSFGLDLAYLDWNFVAPAHLWLGRTANPFWTPGKNQMILDGDLVFEGASLKGVASWQNSKLFITLGSTMISENYDSTTKQDVVDTGFFGAQIAFSQTTDWGEGTLHYSDYRFINIQDKNIITMDSGAKIDAYSNPYERYKGNLVYRPDPLVQSYFFRNKYSLISSGAEWKWKQNPFEVIAFYDRVENSEWNRVNVATEKGISFRWGRTTMQYSEIVKEAESVVGAFTDSDTNGGGTDNRGQKISITYQFSDHSLMSWSKFEAQRGVDTVRRDFLASHLDFSVWF